MAILEVHDIHTYYGEAYVLQGLSIELQQGQILGLLGRNGVGKSTLVNSIVGFTPPRRGGLKPTIEFTSVVLPTPLRPSSPRIWPSSSCKERPWRT